MGMAETDTATMEVFKSIPTPPISVRKVVSVGNVIGPPPRCSICGLREACLPCDMMLSEKGERLAVFLLNLSLRFAARGYSPSEFILRMTRDEIGSHLAMKGETVCRIFAKLRDDGLISVQNKHIRIRDVAGLRRCVNRQPGDPTEGRSK
jgi:hypothetical protein